MVFMFVIFAASLLLTLVMLNLVVAFDAVLDSFGVAPVLHA
jgi:hypothetical protein